MVRGNKPTETSNSKSMSSLPKLWMKRAIGIMWAAAATLRINKVEFPANVSWQVVDQSCYPRTFDRKGEWIYSRESALQDCEHLSGNIEKRGFEFSNRLCWGQLPDTVESDRHWPLAFYHCVKWLAKVLVIIYRCLKRLIKVQSLVGATWVDPGRLCQNQYRRGIRPNSCTYARKPTIAFLDLLRTFLLKSWHCFWLVCQCAYSYLVEMKARKVECIFRFIL